jgi:hypothetical protein
MRNVLEASADDVGDVDHRLEPRANRASLPMARTKPGSACYFLEVHLDRSPSLTPEIHSGSREWLGASALVSWLALLIVRLRFYRARFPDRTPWPE